MNESQYTFETNLESTNDNHISMISFPLLYFDAIIHLFLNTQEERNTAIEKLLLLFDKAKPIETPVSDQLWNDYATLFGLIPENAKARKIILYRELFRIYMSERKYKNAYLLIQKSLNEFASNCLLLSDLFFFFIENLNFLKARETYEKLIQTFNENANKEFLIELFTGILFLYEQKYTNALDCFRKCLTYLPANLIAINNLAPCCILTLDFKRALECLEKIVIEDPASSSNLCFLNNLKSIYEVFLYEGKKKKEGLFNYFAKKPIKDMKGLENLFNMA